MLGISVAEDLFAWTDGLCGVRCSNHANGTESVLPSQSTFPAARALMYGQEVSATNPLAGVIDFRCHTAGDWHAFDQRP